MIVRMIRVFKSKNRVLTLSSLLCLVPLIPALLLWSYIPGQVVIHFDVYGNPDLQVSKFFAFILTPFLFILIHHLIIYLYKKHRKSFGMAPISINYYYILSPIASLIVFLITLKYAIS